MTSHYLCFYIQYVPGCSNKPKPLSHPRSKQPAQLQLDDTGHRHRGSGHRAGRPLWHRHPGVQTHPPEPDGEADGPRSWVRHHRRPHRLQRGGEHTGGEEDMVIRVAKCWSLSQNYQISRKSWLDYLLIPSCFRASSNQEFWKTREFWDIATLQ